MHVSVAHPGSVHDPSGTLAGLQGAHGSTGNGVPWVAGTNRWNLCPLAGVRRFLIEKFGSGGAVLAALACPICFPKLAIIGAAVGLGTLAPYEGYASIAVQALVVLAFAGQVVAFRVHRNRWLVAFSAMTTAALFVGYYVFPSTNLLLLALVALVVGSGWQVIEMRRCARCAALNADNE